MNPRWSRDGSGWLSLGLCAVVLAVLMPLCADPASAHHSSGDKVACRLRDDAYVTRSGLYARGTLKIVNNNALQGGMDGQTVDGDRNVVATLVVHTRKHRKLGTTSPRSYFVESRSSGIYKWEALIVRSGVPNHVHLIHCHTQ